MNKREEQLIVIRDMILENPTVDASLVWDAAKIALEDDYLNDLMVDWCTETNDFIRNEMLNEILNYSHEILRKLKLNENV